MSLLILQISSGSSLQDMGRHGSREFGVPSAGPFDRFSAQVANAALGNESFCPVFELLAPGAVFRCEIEMSIVIFGAHCRVIVSGKTAPNGGNRIHLRPGDELSISHFSRGNMAYLAVPGGVVATQSFGSASGTIFQPGQSIRSGRLETHPPQSWGLRDLPTMANLPMVPTGEFPCGWMDEADLRVLAGSDRRGIRLAGGLPKHTMSVASRPILPGAVQWTPSGELIVIGPDGPTVGGYPFVGTIPTFSMDVLAQAAIASPVRIEKTTWDRIEELSAASERKIAILATALRPSPV